MKIKIPQNILFDFVSVFVILFIVIYGCIKPSCIEPDQIGGATIKEIKKIEPDDGNISGKPKSFLQSENNTNDKAGENSNADSINREISEKFIITLDFRFSYRDENNKNSAYETRQKNFQTEEVSELTLREMDFKVGSKFPAKYMKLSCGGSGEVIELTSENKKSLVIKTVRLKVREIKQADDTKNSGKN